MGITVRIENARINYAPGLWTASSSAPGGNGTKKFGADFILGGGAKVFRKVGPGNWTPTTLVEVQKAIATEALNGDQKKAATWFNALAADKKSVRDGNKKLNKEGDINPAYEGLTYVSAKNPKRPAVRRLDTTEIDCAEQSPIVSGDFVNVIMELYALPKLGLFATLLGTQFSSKGDSLGGGAPLAASDDFENLAEGTDATDFG